MLRKPRKRRFWQFATCSRSRPARWSLRIRRVRSPLRSHPAILLRHLRRKRNRVARSRATLTVSQRKKLPRRSGSSEIQSSLARGGYYQGDPNGKWDSNTVAAMQKFQSANGLDPSGKLDATSLQKLGLGSGIAGVSAPRTPTPAQGKSCCSASPSSPSSGSPATPASGCARSVAKTRIRAIGSD